MKTGPSSVEAICDLLGRSHLLSAEDVGGLQQLWQQATGGSGGLESFMSWLVADQYVTEYQAAMLVQGHGDHFFLGPYKLLERIGKGRMAVVYKAVHRLGYVVAIKVLPPSKARDPRLLARFQREARLGCRLQHPHVVRIFQLNETNGLHYLVMEYLDGETLQEVLERRGRLPPAEAAQLLYQALLGLGHLHEQGLVHRNLEPANLMLVPAPMPGKPDTTLQATLKILDISLSRALFDETSPGAANYLRLTHEGVLLGTPAYLAPEQARDAHTADIRADIYSLGCILYQALAGQPPFPDANPLRQATRHLMEVPRSVAQLNPEVSPGLEEIINWMMAKDPAQRYPTPQRAAQALEVFLITGAPRPSLPESEPHLLSYLNWLEENSPPNDFPAPAAEAPAAKALEAIPIPPPEPPPAPQVRVPAPAGEDDVWSAVSVSPPAAAASDPIPAGQVRNGLRSYQGTTPPHRRDYVLLVIGALGLLAAQVVGILLAHLFQRKAPDESSRPHDRPE